MLHSPLEPWPHQLIHTPGKGATTAHSNERRVRAREHEVVIEARPAIDHHVLIAADR